MHSLEMIVFLNSKRQAAKAHLAAQRFNSGGHAKHSEKTGASVTREDWITHGEWEESRKKRKRKRAY